MEAGRLGVLNYAILTIDLMYLGPVLFERHQRIGC